MTTAAVVAYYREEGEARVSYAGHPPVLYKRANDRWSYARPQIRKDQSDGLPLNIPLSIDCDTLYSQITISMTPGDRLFAYTDGIIDAPNPQGESFGLARLKAALDANTGAPLSELKSTVLKAMHEFTENERTHDDVTLIAMEIC